MNDGAAAQGEDTNNSLSFSVNWKTKCNYFARVRGAAFNRKWQEIKSARPDLKDSLGGGGTMLFAMQRHC